MFGMLKGLLADTQATFQKFADKETAEAVVAIMTGVAWSDGELEEAEKTKMVKGFGTHPILKQFPASVLVAKFNELSIQYEMDTGLGEDAVMKELDDVGQRGKPEQLQVIMRMGVMIAKADGEVEQGEIVFLTKCAQRLGLNIRDYLS